MKVHVIVLLVLMCTCASLQQRFKLEFRWQYVNFSWPSPEAYHKAVQEKTYIPENIDMNGLKYYGRRLYLALPRFLSGVPTTLGYIPLDSPSLNPLVHPFPSWEMNQLSREGCNNLKSVLSMAIDKTGIMWVIDGYRMNDLTKCPPKLVLLDLNNHGRVVHSYTFPNDVSRHRMGYLNDIVIDYNNGDSYAYISENSYIDPGLIVYSRTLNKSWKFRDGSMFPELSAVGISVANIEINILSPINGIALSPLRNGTRRVYYSPMTGTGVFSIETCVLKNRTMFLDGNWRQFVEKNGDKASISDGMTMDDKGNLYYGLNTLYAIGVWNMDKAFSTAAVLDQNQEVLIWPDSFTFDDSGNMRLLCDNAEKFINGSYNFRIDNEVKIRILKLYTGTGDSAYSGS